MFQNAHVVVGLIELTSSPDAAAAAVDDSTLDRLLASLVTHDSLADELRLPGTSVDSDWRASRRDAECMGRVIATTDLDALTADLEREYAQLCNSLGD